ncbi:MAG: hypothetical protein J6A23_09645, partial [Thermoguttaceae bacterium]|nr:hypothetical protein [Thermoguttaceae bacterium]
NVNGRDERDEHWSRQNRHVPPQIVHKTSGSLSDLNMAVNLTEKREKPNIALSDFLFHFNGKENRIFPKSTGCYFIPDFAFLQVGKRKILKFFLKKSVPMARLEIFLGTPCTKKENRVYCGEIEELNS